MPQTPEQQREYQRAWRAKNPDTVTKTRRKYAERNRDKTNERARAYYAQNRERLKARQRGYRERDLAGNRERERTSRLRTAHGRWINEDLAMFRQSQDGRCYLCGELLDSVQERTVIDHDHGHCRRERSCRICRRGLVHDACNLAIGLSGDDPGRLRRMADALEAAQLAFRQRLAASSAGEQLALPEP